MASVSGRAAVTALLACLPLSAFGQDGGAVIVWEYDAGEAINGVDVLPNGDVLFAGKSSGRIFQVRPAWPFGGTVEWSSPDLLHAPDVVRRLPSGNTLVTDTIANQVLELDNAGSIVWSFGTGTPACSDVDLAQPSDITRSGDTFILDQGNDRVLRVDSAGTIVWQYGASPVACQVTGTDQLDAPFGLELLPGGDVLAVEVQGSRVRRLTPTPGRGGTVVWEYGDGTFAAGPNQLAYPARAHLLANGNVLIADKGNDRIIEVQPTPPRGGTIVWQYGQTGVAGTAATQLNGPYDAVRLPGGSTLIADTGNDRLLEVGAPDQLRWRVTCGCSETPGSLLLVLAVVGLSRSAGRKRGKAVTAGGSPVY
jgi:outer membrane protein assembly factor BamB